MSNEDILLNILLDRSGSMGSFAKNVISHYNEYIQQQAVLPGRAWVSLVLFDDKYEEVYINKPITEVPTLTSNTYFTRGFTAYYDALGKLINKIEALPDKPDKVVFVVNTDGLENASREFRAETLKTLIEKAKDKGWEFVFIGAGIDAIQEGVKIGINPINTFTAAASVQGYADTYNALGSTTTRYRTGISRNMNISGIDEEEEEKAGQSS